MIETIPSSPLINVTNNFHNPQPLESSILRHKKQQYHYHNQQQLQQLLSSVSQRKSSPYFETSSSSPPPALSQTLSSSPPRPHQSLSSSPSSQLPSSSSSSSSSPWKSPTVQKKMAASRSQSQNQCYRLLNNQSSSPPPPSSSSSSSSQSFSDRLDLMSKFFDLCNPCEKVLTMCALAKKMKKRDVKFFNRILDQLMTSDPCDGDDNDDDRNEDDDDDEKLEMEANDPNYVRNLSDLNRSEMITNLLLRFPLLKPGNNQAKQEYLKVISKAINFSTNDESFSNKTSQLLTYIYIHPALKRNEFMAFAHLLNGSSGARNISPTNHNSHDHHHHHHHHEMELADVEDKRVKAQAKNDEDSDDVSDDVNESRGQANKMEMEDVVDPIHATSTMAAENNNKIWNHSNHNSFRDSSRYSLLSTCSSRDSGIYMTGQFDNSTKKSLAPSLSMPVSRELPESVLGQQGELTFLQKMHLAGRSRPSFPSSIQQSGWNNGGGFGAFQFNEGIDDTKPHNAISSVPKIDGHARLSRTVSLVPDWLNKVNKTEEMPNPAFRMRLILGPNSSHLPLSPQSSTNSTDSNESQSDMRMMSDGKDSDWSMVLQGWLKNLRLHKYAVLLQKLSYDDLLALGEDWLIQKDITKGARDKLLLNIKKLHDRPAMLDTMDENLKTSPDSYIQTIIIELTQILKTPMKKVTEVSRYCQPHKSPDRENLPVRILNLLCKIRTELMVSKQHSSDTGLISSFMILIKACTNNPCFGEDQRRKLIYWSNQINNNNINNNWHSERNRNFPQRNSTSRFSGFYRTNGSHQPLERRSTALPYSLNNNNNNNNINNNNNNINNHNINGSSSICIQQNPQDPLIPPGFDLKPKMPVNRTHSAPLNGNISPSVLPNRSTLPADITMEDANDSLFDLDPSMEKHALGGMLQDLS